MNTKNTVVVVEKKKKNYIYSKIPRFQRFAGGRLAERKTQKNSILRCVALAKAVLLFQIVAPTGCPIFKNWNFGIFRAKVVFSSLKSSTYKIPILCSRLEQLYIRDKFWNSKLEQSFWQIPRFQLAIPKFQSSWNLGI